MLAVLEAIAAARGRIGIVQQMAAAAKGRVEAIEVTLTDINDEPPRGQDVNVGVLQSRLESVMRDLRVSVGETLRERET